MLFWYILNISLNNKSLIPYLSLIPDCWKIKILLIVIIFAVIEIVRLNSKISKKIQKAKAEDNKSYLPEAESEMSIRIESNNTNKKKDSVENWVTIFIHNLIWWNLVKWKIICYKEMQKTGITKHQNNVNF